FVRSSSTWSAGIRVTECSILNAYIQLIDTAKNHEKFRVYVVLPLLPGFNTENAIEAVLYLTMRSISKDGNSLCSRLKDAGDRDSEIAIVIEDIEFERGIMNGQEVECGKFCSGWRKKLFGYDTCIQHRNPDKIDISDPVSDEFYTYFRKIARNNTLIFEEVFKTVPSDRVRHLGRNADYYTSPRMATTDPERAHQRLKEITGVVVEIPLDFRCEENFMPAITTKEGLIPITLWT
ncbi:unnamed protein product, partial [Didymodactylos carnosus]